MSDIGGKADICPELFTRDNARKIKQKAPAPGRGQVVPLWFAPSSGWRLPDAGRKRMPSNRRLAAKYLIRTRPQKERPRRR
jgi:hypothetical protein